MSQLLLVKDQRDRDQQREDFLSVLCFPVYRPRLGRKTDGGSGVGVLPLQG